MTKLKIVNVGPILLITDDQRREINESLPLFPETYVKWPETAPQQFNGVPDACDMWTGHCLCGATHKEGA